jgi:hypothetical protein
MAIQEHPVATVRRALSIGDEQPQLTPGSSLLTAWRHSSGSA